MFKISRRKGSSLLVITIVCGAILSIIAVSTAKISQAALNSFSSSKIALQAQQYAAAKASLINQIKYTNLTNQTKTAISGTSFYEEVTVGAENTVTVGSQTAKQKIATINIYHKNENVPRCKINFPKLSVSAEEEVSAGVFGDWNNSFPASGTAPSDGIICVKSNSNTIVKITTSGVERVYTAKRDKYGQGSTSVTCPIKKGESYSISGSNYRRFLPFK